MVNEAVQKELADWIDADVIAEALLEDREANGIKPTFENAEKLWNNILMTELHPAIQSTINHAPEFN